MDSAQAEWRGQLVLNIDGVRALYDHLDYAIQMWPGSPARPAEEQMMLQVLKEQMFMMRCDFNMTFLEAKNRD